jgi:hypothetical protein
MGYEEEKNARRNEYIVISSMGNDFSTILNFLFSTLGIFFAMVLWKTVIICENPKIRFKILLLVILSY